MMIQINRLQLARDYLKRLHHELGVNQKDATHPKLPLLKLLHQLLHHRKMCIKFNLTCKNKTPVKHVPH